MKLEKKDKEILRNLQEDIPLTKEPFKEIAKRVGIEEEELFRRIERLIKLGIIRKFGLRIDVNKVGFSSTLIGMKVPEEQLDLVAKETCKYEFVTHCYAREGEYNLWITVIGETDEINDFIKKLEEKYEILNLPVEKRYKIRVKFDA